MPDPRPVTISNTSPLQYLHQCGLTDLLVKLYEEILVPPAVVQELAAGRALGFDLPDPTAFPWVRIVQLITMSMRTDLMALSVPRSTIEGRDVRAIL